MKLYEIANDIKQLISDEEIPAEALADTLESLNMEFEDKAENIIKAIRNEEAAKKAFKDEAEAFNKKAKSCDTRINSMKEYLRHEMLKLEKKSLTAGNHSIGIRQGIQVAEITDETVIPDDYIQSDFVEKIDKVKILADLKAGKEILGAEIKRNPSTLTIK